MMHEASIKEARQAPKLQFVYGAFTALLSLPCCFPLQAAIRKELNDFKSNEMEVHESSRHLTR